MDKKAIGRLIAERRKEFGLTQSELATKLNVTEKAVSRWECGRGYPDVETFPPLAQALSVTIEELMLGYMINSGKQDTYHNISVPENNEIEKQIGDKGEGQRAFYDEKIELSNAQREVIYREIKREKTLKSRIVLMIVAVLLLASLPVYFIGAVTGINGSQYELKNLNEIPQGAVPPDYFVGDTVTFDYQFYGEGKFRTVTAETPFLSANVEFSDGREYLREVSYGKNTAKRVNLADTQLYSICVLRAGRFDINPYAEFREGLRTYLISAGEERINVLKQRTQNENFRLTFAGGAKSLTVLRENDAYSADIEAVLSAAAETEILYRGGIVNFGILCEKVLEQKRLDITAAPRAEQLEQQLLTVGGEKVYATVKHYYFSELQEGDSAVLRAWADFYVGDALVRVYSVDVCLAFAGDKE